MLKLMRKKMRLIILIMVIAFGSTMFLGSVYFGFFGRKSTRKGSKKIPKEFRGEIAVIGDTPIDIMKFNETLNKFVAEISRRDITLKYVDPDLLEYLRYEAYRQALQFTILLKEAKKRGIKAKRKEVNDSIKNIIILQNLRDKRELKDLLKKNNYPYKLFIKNLKNNIVVQKLIRKLNESVKVTDEDVNSYYKKVKAKHILIKIKEDKKGKKKGKDALRKAKEIHKEIKGGLAFEKAAKKYSEDLTKNKGGDLGWFSRGKMIPEFEKEAFALKKGEVSQPIKTIYGYHIIKLEDFKDKRPKNFNPDKVRKEIENKRKRQNIEGIIGAEMTNKKIKIFDHQLLAYRYKMMGNFDKAVFEYRSMVVENPANPIPHYMAGKVLEMKGDLAEAKKELEKAKTKQFLSKGLAFGEINIALGNIYKKEGNRRKALAEYELASKNSKDRASVHQTLVDIYKKMGLYSKVRKEEAMIAEIKKNALKKQKLLEALKKKSESKDKEKTVEKKATPNK